MSTSLIYHGFGVKGYRYLRTEYGNGCIRFHVEKRPNQQRCAGCGSGEVIRKGRDIREIRTLPIGKRPVFLVLHLHRLFCKTCGALRQEPIEVAAPKKHWAKALERYVVELLRHSTVEDVARHLGMSWDTVKEIHLSALRRKYPHRKLRHLKYLGVDEIAVRKGHSYLTVVVDLVSGAVVWVAPHRTTESLEVFLRLVKRSGAQIKAIAMDLWQAYTTAVLRHFPSRVIVFDRYHIIARCNDMLDAVRRGAARDASRAEKAVYIGVRYLLLGAEEKIETNVEAKAKLERLFAINQPLYTAYLLKEELRAFWNCTTRTEAEQSLENWLKKAQSSRVVEVVRFAQTIATHRTGLLNYFDHPCTTGKVEGINNKIKVLKRQAYGFRDMDYFSLRIYALHESRYSLIG